MKSIPFTAGAAIVGVHLLAPAAYAEDAPLPMIGIGVALPLAGVPGGSIHVPVNIARNIRIEVGLGRIANSTEVKGTKADLDTSSTMTVGCGAFWLVRPDDKYVIYVGPRFSLGAEAGFGGAVIGQTKIESVPAAAAPATPEPTSSASVMSTIGTVFARFYCSPARGVGAVRPRSS
ncbi:MAG: hypothetical protein EXR79_00725 [Myxococcales bacterium]|nr:hypothetical protein [Myxococcales bacterium]